MQSDEKKLGSHFLEKSLLVMEQTPKYQTLNTPNIECLNIELSKHHILDQNRTSNKSNITKKLNSSQTSNFMFQD